MTDLNAIVRALIANRREGDYWDFKREPHAKPGDLIKDVICLANSPRHVGDRYIIYGVDDTGTVVGMQSATHRTQADIVNTLSNAGFAGGIFPDIYLRQIKVQGLAIEVLVIKDRPEKPYYLERAYNRAGVRLTAGTVYSRVRDSNTPSDQVASSNDIEKMWRERFGLDLTPFERFREYLLDKDSWVQTSEHVWHHSQWPEFTISPTEEEMWAVQAGENWVRAAMNPSAYVRPLRACFHQTMLTRLECILYDEMRAITPVPSTHVVCRNDRWFFSLCAGTLEFRFLRFLTGRTRKQILQDGLSGGRGLRVPVICFHSDLERQDFIQELKRDPVTVEERHHESSPPRDPVISERDREIIAYCSAVIERFVEWSAGT